VPTDKPRINVTLSQPTYELLQRLSAVTSTSMSGLVSSMLEGQSFQLLQLLNAAEAYLDVQVDAGDAVHALSEELKRSLQGQVTELFTVLDEVREKFARTVPPDLRGAVGDPDRAAARAGGAKASKGSSPPALPPPGRSSPPYSNTGVSPHGPRSRRGHKKAAAGRP
jgi:hypothetical protein